ncbi:MAG: YdcF family protein [Pseudomonadota bacterium]
MAALAAGALATFNARQSAYMASTSQALAAGTQHETAIVLTGGPGRVSQGLALLSAGRVRHVFISGVGQGVRLEDLPDTQSLPQALVSCCVTLGYEARDTIGNAREISRYLQGKAPGPVYVVTSQFHMPRALAELRAVMPQRKAVPISVASQMSRRDIAYEFTKYVAALVRLRFAP